MPPSPASSSRVLSQRAGAGRPVPAAKGRSDGVALGLSSTTLERGPALGWGGAPGHAEVGERGRAEFSRGSEFLAPEHRAPSLSPELREAVMLARTDPLSLGLLRLPLGPPPLSSLGLFGPSPSVPPVPF